MSSSLVSAEGALIQESGPGTETETEGESDDETETIGGSDGGTTHAVKEGHIEEPVGDEETRRALREQLKRSITHRNEGSSDVENISLSPTLEISESRLDIFTDGKQSRLALKLLDS